MSKKYICVCGRVFDKPNSFNAHKSHCKEHLGADRYQLRLSQNRRSISSATEHNKQASQSHKQNLEKMWLSEQHRCERCGKIMKVKYGSGRFCSQSCANSHIHTKEQCDKIRESICLYHIKNGTKRVSKPNQFYQKVEEGKNYARRINLSQSPYCEYNVVYEHKLLKNRPAYKLCLYDSDYNLVKSEYILVHRYKMACKVGYKLSYNEVVHHKDGNTLNNDLSNLVLMSRSEHSRLHSRNKSSVAE